MENVFQAGTQQHLGTISGCCKDVRKLLPIHAWHMLHACAWTRMHALTARLGSSVLGAVRNMLTSFRSQ